jgi:poly(A) polymerase
MAVEKRVLDRVPDAVVALLGRVRGAGGRAWLVGGTVRDLLLGSVPADYDVATDLPPPALAALFPDADLRDLEFGACRLRDQPWPVVVTSLRAESDYVDHRRPGRVWFVRDPALDAARRDFTCNAIYLDAVTGALLDPTGGVADLQARLLRAIGDPRRRFDEDALRLLRALRFCARLDARLEPATEDAARGAARLLRELSGSRVYEELTRTFTGPNRGRALRLFVELGFAAVVLPEVAAMDGVTQPPEFHPEGDVLTHVGLVLDHLPPGDAVLAWSALLHDVGKPPTWRQGPDRIRFDGHDALSATMADAILKRLAAPREVRAAVVEICRDHIRIASLPRMRPRRRERWLRGPLLEQHLAFHRADCLGSHGDLSLYETTLAAWRALPPVRQPLLTGADVLALGVPEGPLVGELLRAVDQRLDERAGPAPERTEALALLAELARQRVKP